MAIVTSQEIPAPWQAAMDRATKNHLRTFPLAGMSGYAVRSQSRKGFFHVVTVTGGKITHCSDCQWWGRHGRSNPCAHAGAVAKRLLREREMAQALAAKVPAPAPVAVPAPVEAPVEAPVSRGRTQIFREEVA